MAYENPYVATYTLAQRNITTAGRVLRVMGPAGMVGRLVGIGAVITTPTTVADTVLQVGSATDAVEFGTLTVPIGTAGVATNAATINPTDDNVMPADAPVMIATDGGATAGAVDMTVTIAWY